MIFRPLRNYFYWEPHCFDIPILRSDQIGVRFARRHLPTQRPVQQDHRQSRQAQRPSAPTSRAATAADRHSGSGTAPAAVELRDDRRNQRAEQEALQNATAIGKGVRRRQERRLVLPVAGSVRQRGLQARAEAVPVAGRQGRPNDHHPRGTPATPEGISHIDGLRDSAFDAIKATPLSDAKIYVAGTAATYKDIQEGSHTT